MKMFDEKTYKENVSKESWLAMFYKFIFKLDK